MWCPGEGGGEGARGSGVSVVWAHGSRRWARGARESVCVAERGGNGGLWAEPPSRFAARRLSLSGIRGHHELRSPGQESHGALGSRSIPRAGEILNGKCLGGGGRPDGREWEYAHRILGGAVEVGELASRLGEHAQPHLARAGWGRGGCGGGTTRRAARESASEGGGAGGRDGRRRGHRWRAHPHVQQHAAAKRRRARPRGGASQHERDGELLHARQVRLRECADGGRQRQRLHFRGETEAPRARARRRKAMLACSKWYAPVTTSS